MLVAEGLVAGRSGFRVGPFEFSAEPGTLLALVGPNGGGKTTLLRALAGLDPPIAGRVARPGLAPPALLPAPGTLAAPFTAEHMVALGRAGSAGWGMRLDPRERAAAQAALHKLGIGGLASARFDRLSSGEQQLVLLARLLVQDAPLCLLDEPTALLDPGQSRKVAAAIRALADGGRMVVVATHDIGLARGCDRVVTVGADRASGPPEAVLTLERLRSLYGLDPSACDRCGR